jgi:amino acid exporter
MQYSFQVSVMAQLSLYLPGIILAYSAFLLSIMSPGPNILAVIGTSMGVNRKSGVALALGVAGGSFCWEVLTVVGLSAILSAYASALIAIKIAGGFYLLWLAYKSLRSAASAHEIEATALAGGTRSPVQYLARGFIVQMTNPKAAFAWIAIVSLGLQDGAPYWIGLAIIIGTAILSLVIHCLYAIAFSTPVMMHIYSRARRWIQGVFGVFFAFAGIKLLTSR